MVRARDSRGRFTKATAPKPAAMPERAWPHKLVPDRWCCAMHEQALRHVRAPTNLVIPLQQFFPR